MPLSHSLKWILVLIGFMLCVGGWLLLAFFLPFYLETRLLPRWAADAGLDPQTIRLRRIGWRGADTGPIRLKIGDLSFGEVDAIQIDYSPASIAARRIDGIVLSGLNLSLTLNETGDAIAGWHPLQPGPMDGPATPVADLPQKIPVGLKRLALRNASITVHWRGRTLEIPFGMEVDTSRLDQGHVEAEARLSPRGAPIQVTGALETGANTLALTVTAIGLEAARFSDLLALFTDLPFAGRMNVEARTSCRLQPLTLASTAGELRVFDLNLPLPAGRIVQRRGPEAEAKPVMLQWQSDDGRSIPWSLGPLDYQGAATLHVDGVEGRLALEAQGWNAEARARLLLPAQTLAVVGSTQLSICHPLTMEWTLAAGQAKEGPLQWALRSLESTTDATANRWNLQAADWQVESLFPKIEADGEISQGGGTGRYQVTIEALSARHPSAEVILPAFILAGRFQTAPELAVQAAAELTGLHGKAGAATVALPDTRLTADLKKEARNWSVHGELGLSNGHAQYDPQQVKLQPIAVRLPIHYPWQPQSPAGTVQIGQILWQSRSLGALGGNIGFGSAGLWSELRHTSKLFPGMTVQIRSELGKDGALCTLAVPPFKLAQAVDVGRIVPDAQGILFQGQCEANAAVHAKGPILQSRGRIRIDQATLRHAARQLTLEGIACDLHLEDLIHLRSAPRQQLQVADLVLGKLAARQLSVDFQLEPDSTLFIERAGMQWCKGSMQTQAFRLMPGKDEVEVTIYCDRLNLAMVLDQLGAAQGSGDGAVNGRIPLQWKNGELRFDNGFLYSTPGQTGTIRLSGTQTLLEGLAPGTPQHTQLDIASEALKDYSYNWAKLDLRSEDDSLLVSLKLDGKPNRLLPFAYDPPSGGFKRFNGQGQAEFKGINIDLNFRTPLREILHYRQLMAPKNVNK
jgi:hypothetical protein